MNSPIWQFESRLTNRLFGWSIFSLLSGLLIWFAADDFRRGFGIQCAAWGLVDFGIALVGTRSAARRKSTADPKNEARNIRRILWINFGLDVFYILGGYWLIQTNNELFWQGTGWGIIIQGMFLFFFDLIHALSVPTIEVK